MKDSLWLQIDGYGKANYRIDPNYFMKISGQRRKNSKRQSEKVGFKHR